MIKCLLILLVSLGGAFLAADITVLQEGFENGALPEGWTQEYVTGSVDWAYTAGGVNGHPNAPHNGSFNARFFQDNTAGYTTRLITPEFSLNPESLSILSFWYALDAWTGYQDELQVYYRTSFDGEWIELAYYDEDIPSWTQEYIELPEAGPSYYLAFEGKAMWGYGVCLDDILVEDDVMNIFIWDHDNNSHYPDQDFGGERGCEEGLTMALDNLGIDYVLGSNLPADMLTYQLIFVELGLYCVG